MTEMFIPQSIISERVTAEIINLKKSKYIRYKVYNEKYNNFSVSMCNHKTVIIRAYALTDIANAQFKKPFIKNCCKSNTDPFHWLVGRYSSQTHFV